MAVFIVLWPYLLTTKLMCLQKNNIGHTKYAMHFASAMRNLEMFQSKKNDKGPVYDKAL